jgi:LytS/YehU family sensor histidine kinase
MESMRFRGKFNYQISVDPKLNPNAIDIPPMLFQPFVENAIWHGLMHKKETEERFLSLSLVKENGHLVGLIEDNGIGREKAQMIRAQKPTKAKKSIGMQITQDRMKMINQLYNFHTSLEIIDLKNEDGSAAGTKVVIKIPI